MAAGLKFGDRVRVAPIHRLHVLSRVDPEVLGYCGKSGFIVLQLPKEMGFERMYRVEFNDTTLKPLAFLARELDRA